jgi:O-antigen/teichoic acid export membrane protein
MQLPDDSKRMSDEVLPDPGNIGGTSGSATEGADGTGHDEVGAGSGDSAIKGMFGSDLLYLAGTVLPLALTAAIVPLATRALGARQFGITSLALTICQLLWYTFSLGLQVGIQRVYAGHEGPERAGALILISSAATAALTAITLFTVPYWAPIIGAGQSEEAMRLATIWGGTSAITFVGLSLLRSRNALRTYLFVAVLQSVGAQAAGLGLAVATHHTAVEYLTGVVAVQLVATLFAVIATRPHLRPLGQRNWITQALLFSLPLVPQQVSGYVLWAGDRFIVQRDLGARQTGRYAVAYAVGSIALSVFGQVNQVWLPRVFAEPDRARRRALLQSAHEQLNRLMLPLLVALAAAIPFLLLVAAPHSYRPLSLVFLASLIAPSAIPQSEFLANMRALLANGETKALALVTAICAAANIWLNIILVPHLGLNGSALATIISYALLAGSTRMLIRNANDRLDIPIATRIRDVLVVLACIGLGALPIAPLLVGIRVSIILCGIGIAGLSWRSREGSHKAPAVAGGSPRYAHRRRRGSRR